jgi:hypothetical protein
MSRILLALALLAGCVPALSSQNDTMDTTTHANEQAQEARILIGATVATALIAVFVFHHHPDPDACDVHAVQIGHSCSCTGDYYGDGHTCLHRS